MLGYSSVPLKISCWPSLTKATTARLTGSTTGDNGYPVIWLGIFHV